MATNPFGPQTLTGGPVGPGVVENPNPFIGQTRDGKRIGDALILDQYNAGQFAGMWGSKNFGGIEDYLKAQGIAPGAGDIWEAEHGPGDAGVVKEAGTSKEWQDKLGGYQVVRLGSLGSSGVAGDTPSARMYGLLDGSGKMVATSDPYGHSGWRQGGWKPMVAGLGAVIGGGLLYGAAGGAGAAGAGAAGEAGAAGAAAGSGVGANATNAALIDSFAGTAGYGASSAGAGGGAGLLGGATAVNNLATNPALIDSAAGTAGYGASSAGAGGIGAAESAWASLTNPLLNAGGSGLGQMGSGLLDWAAKNPKLIGGLLGAVAGGSGGGGSGGGSGGGAYNGPMPTITRGNWAPTAQAQMMAVPDFGTDLKKTGNANSGLWRYGQ